MRSPGLLRQEKIDEQSPRPTNMLTGRNRKRSKHELYLAYRGYAFCALAVDDPTQKAALVQKALIRFLL